MTASGDSALILEELLQGRVHLDSVERDEPSWVRLRSSCGRKARCAHTLRRERAEKTLESAGKGPDGAEKKAAGAEAAKRPDGAAKKPDAPDTKPDVAEKKTP